MKPRPPTVRPLRRGSRRGTLHLGVLMVVVLFCAWGDVSAQGADRNRMTEGDSVRARLTGRMTVAAVFNRWQPDGIVLDVEGFTEPYRVELENLERLDVYMERTSSESFRNGALLGGTAGLFIGAVVGLLLHRAGVIDDEAAPPAEVVTDALSFAGFGLVGGVLVGGFYASSRPGSGWIRVELPAS